MKLKLTLTLTDVNYRILEAAADMTAAASVNAWTAFTAVEVARSRLEAIAKTNPQIAELLSAPIVTQTHKAHGSYTKPDDATPSFEALSIEVFDNMEGCGYEPNTPGYALYLQKRIGEREMKYPGFAKWQGKQHPQHKDAAEGALAWIKGQRVTGAG